MKPILHQFPHSPFCLPVTRALEALGVAYEVRNESNAHRDALIRLTGGACYQVPILEHAGRVIFDGCAGLGDGQDLPRYVDQTWGGGRLFPPAHEGLQALLLRYIENDVESVTFKLCDLHYLPTITDLVERTMIVRHKERRFGRGCVDLWRTQQVSLQTEAAVLLRPLDQMLAGQPFLIGERPVYSDFALWGVCANLTWRDWNPLPPGLPALARWFGEMRTLKF